MAEDYSLVRGLVRDWEKVHEHEAKPNPHDQYVLNTEGLAAWAFAAYAGIRYSGAPYTFPDIGAAWQDLDFMADLAVAVPRHITANAVNSTLAPDQAGVYFASVSLSFNHIDAQSGRITSIRLYNHTTATSSAAFQIGTGRNTEVTSASVSMFLDVPIGSEDNEIGLQIGGGDAYQGVGFSACAFNLHSVGEYRGLLVTPVDGS